jgi:DNA helicase II / ATP-dependent DNA helicase PcrA
LEFDAVFITGLEEGLFPHENSLNDHEGLEEERRLMYVAITRARKRLYLSFSQTRMLHGQTRYNIRSRFLEELPEGALKWLTPKQGVANLRHFNNDAFASALSAPPVLQKSEPEQGLRAKMRVFHNKFGEGVVVTVEGSGADARAQVSFARHGVKWLALSVAKLTPI